MCVKCVCDGVKENISLCFCMVLSYLWKKGATILSIKTLSTMTFSITAPRVTVKKRDTWHKALVTVMFSVANKPITLSVANKPITLSVVMLSVIMLIVVALQKVSMWLSTNRICDKRAMTLSITIFSIMKLCITTLIITTLSRKGLFVTLSINDIQHKRY
jgi:hypothetical protein